MSDVFHDFSIASRRLRIVSARGQCRGWRETGSFLTHSLHFTFLRLTELRCNDDQAEVDHEEGANLQEKKRGTRGKTRRKLFSNFTLTRVSNLIFLSPVSAQIHTKSHITAVSIGPKFSGFKPACVYPSISTRFFFLLLLASSPFVLQCKPRKSRLFNKRSEQGGMRRLSETRDASNWSGRHRRC